MFTDKNQEFGARFHRSTRQSRQRQLVLRRMTMKATTKWEFMNSCSENLIYLVPTVIHYLITLIALINNAKHPVQETLISTNISLFFLSDDLQKPHETMLIVRGVWENTFRRDCSSARRPEASSFQFLVDNQGALTQQLSFRSSATTPVAFFNFPSSLGRTMNHVPFVVIAPAILQILPAELLPLWALLHFFLSHCLIAISSRDFSWSVTGSPAICDEKAAWDVGGEDKRDDKRLGQLVMKWRKVTHSWISWRCWRDVHYYGKANETFRTKKWLISRISHDLRITPSTKSKLTQFHTLLH